jgi:hypothetical protein
LPRDVLRACCAVRERWRFLPVEKLPTFSHRTPCRSWCAKRGLGASLASALFPQVSAPSQVASEVQPSGREPRKVHLADISDSPDCLVQPLPDDVLARGRWSLVVKGAWQFPASMHCKEGRVALLSLQRCARDRRLHGTRIVTIGDNLAEICACEKGRSADPLLRGLLQRALAYTLGPEIQWFRRYAESARNPSDFDSRWALRCKAKCGERRTGPAAKEGGTLTARLPRSRFRPALALLSGRPPASSRMGKFGPRDAAAGSARFGKDGHLRTHSPSRALGLGLSRPGSLQGKAGPRATQSSAGACSPPGLLHWYRSKNGEWRGLPAPFSVASSRGLGRCGVRRACEPCPAAVKTDDRRGGVPVRGPTPGDFRRLRKNKETFWSRAPPPKPAAPPPERGGRPKYFLELFSGCGYLTAACHDAGLRCATPFDIKTSRLYDLTRPSTQRLVLRWIRCGFVWCVHLGTPCSGFSVAQHGENNASTRLSHACAVFSLRVIRLCRKLHVHWSLENPASSKLWKLPGFVNILSKPDSALVRFHMCRYGAPWLKPTCIATSLPLDCLERRCHGCHWHMVLQGLIHLRTGEKCWLTSVAGCYPPALCRAWSKAISRVCPAAGWRHGAPLRCEKWDAQLQQCPGCALLPGGVQPRLPRSFQLPFELDCQRQWTNF